MPKDGWNEELAYTGPKDRIEDVDERIRNSTDFWEIVVEQTSWGHLPDGYPFNWEGSAELRDSA